MFSEVEIYSAKGNITRPITSILAPSHVELYLLPFTPISLLYFSLKLYNIPVAPRTPFAIVELSVPHSAQNELKRGENHLTFLLNAGFPDFMVA